MTMKRTGGFLASPRAIAVMIFALLILALYAMLTSNVGVPMLEWAKGAVPAQLESLLTAIGC